MDRLKAIKRLLADGLLRAVLERGLQLYLHIERRTLLRHSYGLSIGPGIWPLTRFVRLISFFPPHSPASLELIRFYHHPSSEESSRVKRRCWPARTGDGKNTTLRFLLPSLSWHGCTRRPICHRDWRGTRARTGLVSGLSWSAPPGYLSRRPALFSQKVCTDPPMVPV